MRINQLFLILLLVLCVPAAAQAKIVIASGAGYRSLVDDLTASYTKDTGNQVERIYGNMSRVTAQASVSGAVDMVIGDLGFLEKAQLDFKTTDKIGNGKLVVIFPKGSAFNGEADLLASKVTRIALPDTKRAIYGKAALQYMRSKGIYDKIESKLLIVATVPQAASYVIAGEVDYALINLTHARKISKSIGGFSLIDENTYSPISIVIGQLKSSTNKKECDTFLKFLKTDKAQKITASHGM
ncbi:molybdate ABC transporter substrate-binding protein [Maridesulfovibrio ferrireducens]|uniref:molybdate ABC transporter substrate-binding protein n=1 Tax=Maridesulfovibrio ferrireducens TaxID=246191 RepID=UPI001A2BAF9E|nr:molybdate ABC transporter substrate-binding protein [Maridesulfovibrio ferrireducens]MBI9112911.1 molybdate ABC transporter substrate-binding protein [Maridesulfovibrio ferrireducens]